MAFPEASEVDLILALQDGAAGGGNWASFLGRLAGITGARFAAMVSREPGLPDAIDIVTATPSGAAIVVDEAALRFALTDRMRPERIYSTGELADLSDTSEGVSLDPALARLGAVSVTAMRIAVPTVTITLGIFGAGAFVAADGAVLRRLVPYLQAAARTASRVWHGRLHATITADLARRNSLGWFLLDRAGVVLDSWVVTMPAVSSAVRVLPGAHGDRLALADRAAEPVLTTVLERSGASGTPREQALWVSRDPPLHLRIRPVPLEWGLGGRRPVALATLHGEVHLAPDAAGLLVDLFGLLPSEARLAAMLAGGHRLSDAAVQLGLTIETARNYSKKIFAKTGTAGQADLVRIILASGLAELGHMGAQ